MKKILLSMTIFLSILANAQVGINTETPDESSVLHINSQDKGVLFPTMTEAERDGIQNPAIGLIIFNMSNKRLQMNIGTRENPVWETFSMGCCKANDSSKELKTELKCSTIAIKGAYKTGVDLNNTNYINIDIDVKELATDATQNQYSISTNTVNGYSFSTSGTFTSTGVQTIKLQGNGTPTNAGTDNLTLTFKDKSCNNIETEVTPSEPKIISIGDGTLFGSTSGSGNPVFFDNGYKGWGATIYNKSQIGSSGTITAISYLIVGGSYGACESSVSNQEVYMALVDKEQFTDTEKEDISKLTEVFKGTITWVKGATPDTGWTRIILDKPFKYDNTKNLLIYVVNNSGKGDSCLGGIFGGGPAFRLDIEGAKGDVSKYFSRYSSPTKDSRYPIIKIELN